jgi:hypothetical protein
VDDPGERAELEAFRDFYTVLARQGSGRVLEIAGAVCGTIVGQRDVLMSNRVLGLGLERPTTERDLDEIEAFFADAQTRYYVSVRPGAEHLHELLERRGYTSGYAWAIFRRGVEPYEASTQLAVDEIGADQAGRFGAVVARAYEMPSTSAEAIAHVVGRPGWYCWLSYDGDEPAGAAALFVHGRAGWLGFAGTLPQHRRKGSQGALFAARIRKSAQLEVELLATETGALEPGRPSNSYRNITRVGFEEIYVRPNYTPSAGDSSLRP